MAYQDEKYENHFLAIVAGTARPTLLQFSGFTKVAISRPGVPASVAARESSLSTAHANYQNELVQRIGAGGTSKTGTQTEQQAFETFKAFIQRYDATALNGYFFDRADQRPTYYPDELSGLTQALKSKRLGRLTAYVEALERADATLSEENQLPAVPVPPGSPAGAKPQRPGVAARALLTAYETAATTRTAGRTGLKKETLDMTPAGQALAEELWAVHCLALAAHWQTPAQAKQYFDYARLPHRNARSKKP